MKIPVSLALTALVGGCVPATSVDVPALRGRVVDRDDRPIGNAVVRVARDSDGVVLATATTAADGRFARPAVTHVTVRSLIGDAVDEPLAVTASDGARSSAAVRAFGDLLNFYDCPPAEKDLGDFRLQ